jgi:hypothetical protein
MNRLIPRSKRRSLAPARFLSVLGAISVLVLVLAAPALAQDPTQAQYDNSVTQVTNNVGGGPGSGPSAGNGSSEGAPVATSSGLQKSVVGGLPFTGLDLIALAAVAVAFTSLGFALRRMTAPKRTA